MVKLNLDVLFIPLISGGIGWLTNTLAVLMLFYPKEFVGIKPFLGWQGVIPRFTPKAAKIVSTLFAEKLVAVDDLFEQIDLDKLEVTVREMDVAIVGGAIEEFAPDPLVALWKGMDDSARDELKNQVIDILKPSFPEALVIAKNYSHEHLEIKELMQWQLEADNEILTRVTNKVAQPELRLIRNSGLYFGIPIGVIQMLIWIVFEASWVLPVLGFTVGYLTNWAALFLIFEPKNPRRILGLKLQGLMHKRRTEITEALADQFGRVLTTPDGVLGYLRSTNKMPKLNLLAQELADLVAKGLEGHPLGTIYNSQWVAKADAENILPKIINNNEEYISSLAKETFGVDKIISQKLNVLNDEDFELILRTVFEQEEWLLLLIGGIIGAAAGWAQYIYIFSTG